MFHCANHLHMSFDESNHLATLTVSMPGVPIFFVVSGFLISLSYERNPSLREYARNRLLRIYPALWVCLAISIASAVVLGGVSFVRRETLGWLVAQITVGQAYTPEFLRSYGTGSLNGSLWTIPVELQFYAGLPLLYRLLRLDRPNFNTKLLLVAIASVGAQFALVRFSESTSFATKLLRITIAQFLWMFVLGVAIQKNFERLRPILVGKAAYWFAAYALVAFAARPLGFNAASNTPHPATMLVLAMMVISIAYSAPGISHKVLRGNDVSYGAYIYHAVVLNGAIVLGAPPTFGTIAIVLVVTGICAWLSWVLVERPALRRKANPLNPVVAPTR